MLEIKKSEFKPEDYSKLTLVTNHRNGNQTYSYECTCDRCNGRGLVVSHVCNGKLVYVRPDNGICYKCLGEGKVTEKLKVVTDENWKEKVREQELTREQILENIRKHEEHVIQYNLSLGYKLVDFKLANWVRDIWVNEGSYYRIIKETEKAYLIANIQSLKEDCYSEFWVPKKAMVK